MFSNVAFYSPHVLLFLFHISFFNNNMIWSFKLDELQTGSIKMPLLSENNGKDNKHNADLQQADPGTKVTGQFSTRGCIFPHDAQNGFPLFSSF